MADVKPNKLKSRTKNDKPWSNVVGDSNDENKILHKLLLTNTQILRLLEAFANNS